ncbi:MAG: hypothetical protein HN894_16195, partial [Bacteroidetes bacterium]|nr:hypothetical protein [Bacteroidota bacterium]
MKRKSTSSKILQGIIFGIAFLCYFCAIQAVEAQTVVLSEDFDSFTSGGTSCTSTCTLTNSWTNETGDDKDWCPRSGSTGSSNTGPSSDHTGSGKYLYTEASSCYYKTAYLKSPSFSLSGNATLTFWYHMYGSTMGSLTVYISTNGGSSYTQLWYKSGDQGNSWQEATIDLSSYSGSSNVCLRFKGETGSSYYSDIAIDDISVTVSNSALSESFDSFTTGNTACSSTSTLSNDWSNSTSDYQDWVPYSGATYTSYTGPSSDHSGSGKYLYMESSSCYNKTADVYSPSFKIAGSSSTLTFWYHMYGSSMGSLTVYINTGGYSYTQIWNMSGDQGNAWQKATLDLSSYAGSSNIRLKFRGTTSPSDYSDMAIDDILVSSSAVLNEDFDSFYSGYTYCTSICNLENGWTNETGDNKDWCPISGSTPSSYTGPSSDHTGSGKYLYTESSSCYYMTALLKSPSFNLNGSSTLSFWYHMYGYYMGSLYVYISTDGGSSYNQIWSKSGDQGNSWQQAIIDLSSYSGSNCILRFQGVTGSSSSSDMAIDDILVETVTPPPANDAGIISFLNSPHCQGTNAIKVELKNFSSTDILSSATINWSVDGVSQTPYYYVGSLSSGASTTIELGTHSFLNSQYSISAWSSSPNGSADEDPSNDTYTIDNQATKLSGTYTIGSSGDYADFTSAVSVLNHVGICGPVVFNIEGGTYDEYISFSSIDGTSSTDTITFQPEGTEEVIFTSSPGNSSYLVKFDGGDYITFKNMTFTAQGSSTKVFHFESGSDYITLDGNILNGVETNSTNSDESIIYSASGTTNSNIVIKNNTFNNGSYGMYFWGSSSNYEYITEIINNTFSEFSYIGIYLKYQNSPLIEGNTIVSSETDGYSNQSGVNLSSCKWATKVSKNFIQVHGTLVNYGLYMYGCQGVSGLEFEVSNNFISCHNSTSNSSGIYCQNSDYIQIYHNSVNVTDGNYNGKALSMYTCSDNEIVNNILANTQTIDGGYSIYLYSVTIANHNYNNLITNGTNLVNWDINDYTDLASWQTASGGDANSISVDPVFFSASDLHSTSSQIDNAGTPLSVVGDDIDGEARDASNPDIGADEFTMYLNDASVMAMIPDTFCPGNTSISVEVKNLGSNPINSLVVNWEINGLLQSPVTYSSTISSAASVQVTLGNYTFNSVTAYDINIWTSLPNNTADGDTSNDTLSFIGVQTALNGNYIIGGASADFLTLNEAVSYLMNYGVCGPVIFNIEDGTYTEQVSIGEIPGVSATDTIIFQASASANPIITFSPTASDNYIVQFNNTEFITYKDLTFTANGTIYGRVFDFANESHNINIDGNTINGLVTTNTGDESAIIFSYDGTSNNNIIIQDNEIFNGSISISFYGKDASNLETNNQIINNHIEDFHYRGIVVYYNDAINISSNTVEALENGANDTQTGIDIGYCDNGNTIANNEVLVFGSSTNSGLTVYSCSGSSGNEIMVYNNFVSCHNSTGISTGFKISSSDYVNAYYNSVNNACGNTSSKVLYVFNGSNIRIANNILANTSATGGYTIYKYGSSNIVVCNLNNLYSAGSYFAFYQTHRSDLSEWRAYTGFDLISVSVNPLFVSNTDLHARSSECDGIANPMPDISTDIDGEPRDASYPDIGADEFTYVATELSGTYTIGGTNPDFESFAAAKYDLDLLGISGPVIFNVREGTYTEQISLQAISGSYSWKTITIQPEASANVVVTYPANSSNNYIFEFDGIEYLNIYGITFTKTGSNYGTVFNFKNESNYITIDGNTLNGTSTNSSSYNYAIIHSASSTNNEYITITDNTINAGSYGIYFEGNSFSDVESGNVISNNTIVDFGYQGIYLKYQDAIDVSSNTVTARSNLGINTNYGIYAAYCKWDCVFAKNRITVYGLNENYGLYLDNVDGSQSNEVNINNNFISCSRSSDISYGMYLYESNYIYTFYNSVNINDGSADNGRGLYDYSCTFLDIKNNILANTQTSGGYAIYTNSTTGINSCDYNNLFTKGDNLGFWSYDCTSLSNWQSVSSLDANSVSVYPAFVSNTDLHANSLACDGAASPISAITNDIDGDARDATNPDIGADEFVWADTMSLAGQYTIGGTNPDYETITDANNALTYFGVSGAIVFKLRTDTFVEQISIQEITGESATNTITFEADLNASPVIMYHITGSENNYIIQLDGADYLSFKNLIFTATSSNSYSYGRVFDLVAGSNNIEISGNSINGVLTSSSDNSISAIYSYAANNNIVISDNDLYNGSFGIYFDDASSNGTGNEILNNNISNCYNGGIRLTNQDQIIVEGNNIATKLSGGYTNQYGIYAKYCDNTLRIVANQIQVYAQSYNYGLYFYQCDGVSGSESMIYNNFVSTHNSTYRSYGIYLSNTHYCGIYNNSVNITDGDDDNGIALYVYYSGNIEVLNNILANTKQIDGGYAYKGNSTNITNSDYNLLFSFGENLAYWGADCANLSALQTSSSMDANSVSAEPFFYSDTNLHINSSACDGAATPIAAITTDIDNEARDASNPDIGADEFLLAPPIIQASNITFANLQPTLMDINWTRGYGDSCTVFILAGTSGTASPVDDVFYEPDADFQNGDQIGTSGWFCVYRGTGTSLTITGLTSLDYRVHVCEFNNGSILYNSDSALNNPSNQQLSDCSYPANQTETNLAATSIDLGWTEYGSASTWDIEWGVEGFTQGNGTTISGVTSNPYTLTGLAVGTIYDWYVRADCGGVDSSTWTGPNTFTIPCPVVTSITDWNQTIKAVASDRAANDWFGHSVSISGDYAIVGAYQEDQDAAGNNYASYAGSAYIFKTSDCGASWTQVQKIVASDRAASDWFGYSVSISGDYAIVGAPSEDQNAFGGYTLSSSGSAYIFKTSDGGETWTETEKIVASDRAASDNFGRSVSISGDFAIVGACYEDEDASGGNTMSTAGSAYIFKTSDGGETWTETEKIVASDRAAYDYFGQSVSISGDYAIVGANEEDEDATGGNYQSKAGSAYIFKTSDGGATWTETEKIVASDRAANDNFGYSVAISGDYAIVGAFAEDEDATGGNTMSSSGSAYIFKTSDGGATWTETEKIVASDRATSDNFGRSVSISGAYAIVSAYVEDEDVAGGNTMDGAGSAYIFKISSSGETWTETRKIVASDRAANDNFGRSVSISGDNAIVGAYYEDEDAAGANTMSDAGSVYIFGGVPATCPEPSSHIATNCFASSAELGWTENGTATTWDIEWGLEGFTLSNGTTILGVTSNPYTLTGLSVGTIYDWYVRANCGGGDSSEWTGPNTFAIPCPVVSDITDWNQIIKAVASDRAASDNFGRSVSISGDYAIVGAIKDGEDAAGGNTMSNAGSAYIFKTSDCGASWTQVQKIVASDRAADDWFGYSVSISGDYAIVGASREDEDATGGNYKSFAGSAYIFKTSDGGETWTETEKVVASDRAAYDYFGSSVSISGDYAIVGAFQEDENAAGYSTMSYAGSAYIFKTSDGGETWTETEKIVASDRAANDYFGSSVSISGDYAIVGAYYEDEDASGGNTMSNAGSAYIFKTYDGGETWTETEKIVASDRAADDYFGKSVSISGDYAIVGAYQEDDDASGGNSMDGAGSAYIFKTSDGGETWTETEKIVASDRAVADYFGLSVSISGDYAIVGVYGEDEDASGGNTMDGAGSAYFFRTSDGGETWTEIEKIIASDRAAADYFGLSVSISGNNAIVGAYTEDEDVAGANTMSDAGSAYFFGGIDASCPDPSSPTESYMTASSADLGWTENGTATSWDIEWALAGFIQGNGTTISGLTSNPYTLTGLTDGTTYDWYIRADCGGDDYSAWTGPYTFTFTIPCPVVSNITDWNQIIKAVASDRAASDYFGYSVSISGEYAIVGAYKEDEDATDGNSISDAGSAYIFKTSDCGASWTQVQKIVASDRAADDHFGYSVSISGDYAIVGAYQEDHDATSSNPMVSAGSAYIFQTYDGGETWTEVQKIVASDRAASDYFGKSVSISGDYAIVGASNEDSDALGGSLMNNTGSAYIFKTIDGGATWTETKKIVASDRAAEDYFGYSVSISGDFVIVGAYSEDEDASGVNTISSTGSAYIFKTSDGGTTWIETEKIVASDRAANDYFGYSVSISGDYAIVGAYREAEDASGGNTMSTAGSAYIFKTSDGGLSWTETEKIVASDRAGSDYFGYSVSISGDYAIVGAYQEDEDAAGGSTKSYAGSAYIFKTSDGGASWTETEKIVASDRAAYDYFGSSVSISGNYAIVGAYREAEDAAGGNTMSLAGSVYIYGGLDTTCDPSSQTESNITASSAELGWTENGTPTSWDIEWGVAGFTQGNGTTISVLTSNPYSLTGLAGGTMYDWYIRSDCGPGSSNWVGPATFTTNVTAPVTQATNVSFSNVQGTQMDISWTRGDGDSCVVFMSVGTSGTALPLDNVTYNTGLTLQDGDQIGISPWFCIYRGTGTSVTVTGLLELTNYRVHVCEFNYGSTHHNISSSTNNPSNQPTPETCDYPSNQTVTNITASSADLGWTENGTATSWDIEWGVAGFIQGNGTTISGLTSNPYSLTGLSYGMYDWYVRANCDGSNSSAWIGPNTFATPCQDVSDIQDWEEIIKAVASDREASDYFGFSVSISGDFAIVSASYEDHNATGNNYASSAGSAYIFKTSDGGATWTEVQKIVASDRAAYDKFGSSVSISGDYAIVGAVYEDEDATGGNTATSAGSAYIFKTSDGGATWTEAQKIVASDRAASDNFGISVSISGDYAIVGAVYEDEDASGNNSMSSAGSAYIFKTADGGATWTEVNKIVASDRATGDYFGYSVSISGYCAIVGAYYEDEDAAGNNFEGSAGSAYIFKTSDGGASWTQAQKIVSSDRAAGDNFGNSVSISGDYAIVGAYYEDEDINGNNYAYDAGSAYIFKTVDGGASWTQAQKIVASDRAVWDEFGTSVSISGDFAIVGACLESEDTSGANTLSEAGSAYIYKTNDCGASWTETEKIVASDRAAYDYFGLSVSISGDHAIVGAMYESEDAAGVNTKSYAGSAYFFGGIASCSNPSSQTVTNITASSVDLGWTENGTATSWEIEYGAPGFSQGSGTVVSGISTNSYTLSALGEGTSYDWYVRADCGGGSLSNWVGPHNFTTAFCTVVVTASLDSEPSCNGLADGSAIATISGGISPFTYSWSNGSIANTASNLLAGTYTVTITDNFNCMATDDVVISQPDDLIVSLDQQTNVSCFGNTDGAIDISVSGGTTDYNYLWSNSETTQDISGLMAGTYSVTVTDAQNCETTETFVVTEPDVLAITLDLQTNISCFGNADGALDISVSGGTQAYSYLWATAETSQDISNLLPGTYDVTVTDAQNCVETETFVVTEPDILEITLDLQTNVSCFGNMDGAIDISVSGGTQAYSYYWANAETSQDISNLAAGTYDVTVTDSQNCTDTESIVITEPDVLELSLVSQTNVSCFGNVDGALDISVIGGTQSYSYYWATAETSQDISGLMAGTYSVTVADAQNCETIETFVVTEPDILEITLDLQTDVSCFGNVDGALDISISGGTQAYSYLWATAETSQDISNLLPGTYDITITDAQNCVETETYVVTEPDVLEITLDLQTNVSCFGNVDGAIDISVSGGTQAYSYLWVTA